MTEAALVAHLDSTSATLTASRALLGVVARSVASALEVVTLPQFRVLVLLSASGPTRVGTLADQMTTLASTFTRSLDRMEVAGWITRIPGPGDRRAVLVELTDKGSQLVSDVTTRREQEIQKILAALSDEDRVALVRAFTLFATAAAEPSVEDLLTLGL
ncbi:MULTISPECIES: MarR family transcriptional regulator [Subtercola]|nr:MULTISPECIES: MarR family transcriptional regulator [Subtercola]MEA9983835.1 MarR family transcriptional regulator [Subtercola sp. RTI3]